MTRPTDRLRLGLEITVKGEPIEAILETSSRSFSEIHLEVQDMLSGIYGDPPETYQDIQIEILSYQEIPHGRNAE